MTPASNWWSDQYFEACMTRDWWGPGPVTLILHFIFLSSLHSTGGCSNNLNRSPGLLPSIGSKPDQRWHSLWSESYQLDPLPLLGCSLLHLNSSAFNLLFFLVLFLTCLGWFFFGFVSIWEHKTTGNCLFPNLYPTPLNWSDQCDQWKVASTQILHATNPPTRFPPKQTKKQN